MLSSMTPTIAWKGEEAVALGGEELQPHLLQALLQLPYVVLPQRQVVQQVAGARAERGVHAFDGCGKLLFQFKGILLQHVQLRNHIAKVFIVCLHDVRGYK